MNKETHDSKQKRLRRLAAVLVSVLAVLSSLLAVWFGRARSTKRRDLPYDLSKLHGLFEEEAESRHEAGQSNLLETHPA